jgi:alpha-L-rhamnosidase
VLQASYRVLVATRPELLSEGRANVWDSGEISSGEPWTIYRGRPLASRTRYFWTVRVRTTAGAASTWSRPGWFETALLDSTDWRGRWIAGPERVRALTVAEGAADDATIRSSGRVLSSDGVADGAADAAPAERPGRVSRSRVRHRCFASRSASRSPSPSTALRVGLGYGDVSVNGSPASDRVLDPQFTDYSRTVLYTTTDVTRLLRSGENVVGVVLGAGQVRRRGDDLGLGMGQGRMARDAAPSARPRRDVRRLAPRRPWRRTPAGA